jgi:ABC-type dipeptide/oligopeptide/nickel transport system permease component
MARHSSSTTTTAHQLSVHFVAFLIGVALIFALTLGLPDAAYTVAGPYATEVALERIHDDFGLNSNPAARLVTTVRMIVTGDLSSMYTREPLIPVLVDKASVSLAVVGLATLFTLLAAALLSALLVRSRRLRHLINAGITISAALPVFITATVLLALTAVIPLPLIVAASISLCIFPSLIIATNASERWQELRRAPHTALAIHYRLPFRYRVARAVRSSPGTGALFFNAIVFFCSTGIVVVEPLFGVTGVGRWLVASSLRLDMPAVFLTGIFLAAVVAVLSFVRALLITLYPTPSTRLRT